MSVASICDNCSKILLGKKISIDKLNFDTKNSLDLYFTKKDFCSAACFFEWFQRVSPFNNIDNIEKQKGE